MARWRLFSRVSPRRGVTAAVVSLVALLPTAAVAADRTLLGEALAGQAAVNATVIDAGWRQDGGGPGRAGYQPVAGRLDRTAATRLRERWTLPAPAQDAMIGGAVIAAGTLFRSVGGQIRRADAVTGADLGPIVDIADRVQGQLAVPQDIIVAESQAVDPPTGDLDQRFLTGYGINGTRLWQTPLPEEMTGGFTVADGLVLRAAGAVLTAFRLADGTVAWTAPLGGEPGFHPPVADAGKALLTVERGTGSVLLAFDLPTGAAVWSVAVSGPRLVAAGGVAYTTGPDGVCGYAVTDGSRRWCDTSLRDPQYAATDGTSLFVVGAGSATAFDVTDGTVRWSRQWAIAGSELATSYWSPVVGGGVLYAVVYQFTARDGAALHTSELLAFDAASGVPLSRSGLVFDALRGAEPVLLSGDLVYFAALEKLFAFGTADSYGEGMSATAERMMRPATGLSR